jgi:hypothetical protein
MISMGYRSGFILTLMLEETKGMSASPGVCELINDALKFTKNYTASGSYRTGRQLVNYLISAARLAEKSGEVDVAERLEDFSEYAAGEIPLHLLEAFYDLGRDNEASNKLLGTMMQVGFARSAQSLDLLIKEKPDATAADARAWLKRLAKESEFLEVMTGRSGGLNFPKNWISTLIWLSRIEIGFPEESRLKVSPRKEIEAVLDSVNDPELLLRAVELRRRSQKLDDFRCIVESPESTEHDIHAALRGQTWIFGGSYVEELHRQRLTTDATLDIPLLRGDGTLHVVELKQANIPKLLERPRLYPVVGEEVHLAAAQASHYLRSLDEHRASILADHGIDSRRAFATVVIGHPSFVKGGYTAKDVSEAFRMYNSHLARIEVLTYQELIDSANRALNVTG